MRTWITVLAAVAVTLPGIGLRLGLYGVADPVAALVYGLAIVGAAFLLSWAAEVFQLDVSQGLALALLALIAILPEYVVDATFAWLAAEDPCCGSCHHPSCWGFRCERVRNYRLLSVMAASV